MGQIFVCLSYKNPLFRDDIVVLCCGGSFGCDRSQSNPEKDFCLSLYLAELSLNHCRKKELISNSLSKHCKIATAFSDMQKLFSLQIGFAVHDDHKFFSDSGTLNF